MRKNTRKVISIKQKLTLLNSVTNLKVQEWKVFQNKLEIVHFLWAEKTESELFFQI